METKSDICSFCKSRTVLEFRLTWDRKTCQTWLRLPFLLQTPSWSPSWPGQNSWAGSGHMDLQPPASGEDDTQGEMLDCWTLSSFQSDTWCNLIGTKHCADLKGCQTGSQNTSFTLIYHLLCSHVHNNGTTDKMWSCQEAIDEAFSPEFKESPLVCDGVGNTLNLSPDLIRPFVFTADISANLSKSMCLFKITTQEACGQVRFQHMNPAHGVVTLTKRSYGTQQLVFAFSKLIQPCQTLSKHRRQTLPPKSILLCVQSVLLPVY